ncbi:probable cyclin-dependent serine/threonine-protein kinase DDB_G0292550 isoform X2 [Diaphorina citri]|uniref:Probable cyclin-dependent serine/threonine-protein kinase DDB_G0292550 isoform X2 n=1 Tax=Diaphorina citri TaxID=121845 RepID=A0A3Q0J1J0_DIACI|nr:probable cyclin-dependent serine/threonine-protein kinase DDB_G0292550 isoform X2 [Diaphorina citri]
MDSLRCPLCCMKVFSCKKELIEHLTCVHSNLACPVCKQQVSDLSTLILHLQYQCINDSEISSKPTLFQNEASSVPQSSDRDEIQTTSDYTLNGSNVGKENKVILLRKRRKSNMSQWSKRKTFGKNNSNEYGQMSSESAQSNEHVNLPSTSNINLPLLDNNSCQTAPSEIIQFGNENNSTQGTDTENVQNQNSICETVVFGAGSHAQSSAAEQTAESEIDFDNISMLSDESSFTTTNDYSSSQNEIISDDDCTENAVGFLSRTPCHQMNSSRHGGTLFRRNDGNEVFINNLQVINNNFYTILLNNGSYEGHTGANANIPQERNRNYQRRNTKNNNSQLNKNCNAPSISSTADHVNVSMHNNLQGSNRSCKNSNVNSMNNANTAGCTISVPGSSLFIVSNNSPNKYAVKNTNISNNLPVSAKEVSTANLENRNTSRSGSVENTTEETTRITQDVQRENDEIARVDNAGQAGATSPLNELTVEDILQETTENLASLETSNNATNFNQHHLITRVNSNRMQKIQNADCIQNSTSSQLNPSASALCKTNSFPLCNYVRSNEANKCKLIKYNANHATVKLRMNSENDVVLNNVHPVHPQAGSTMNMVNNDIATVNNGTNPSNDANQSNDTSQDNVEMVDRDETVRVASPSETNVGSDISSEITNANETVSSQINDVNMCNSNDINQIIKHCANMSVDIANSNSSDETAPNENVILEQNRTTDETLELPAPSTSYLEQINTFQFTSNIPSTLNNTNLNNNLTNTMPTTTQNICSLNNNLHRNKKSNLNQLGGRNTCREEKLFTREKEVNGQQSTAMASESYGTSSYQMINNSIERNFNKLNSSNQEINAHKNVKSIQNTKKSKKSKKPISSHLEGRINNNELNDYTTPSSSNYNTTTSLSYLDSNTNNVITSTNITTTLAANSTNHENIPTTSANVFPETREQMNNSVQTNHHRTLFNNKNSINQIDTTDKNITKVFNKKDLLNIKRNNFDLSPQEHSNVKRSNSLNVRINDLASGTTSIQVLDGNNSTRKNLTKSNSFTIRNNISEASLSQERTTSEKKQNCTPWSLAYKENYSKDLKNNINRRLETIDANSDASNSNDTLDVTSNLTGGDNTSDAMEQFRLEEASNDGIVVPIYIERDAFTLGTREYDLQNDNAGPYNDRVLNNSVENGENHNQAGLSCKIKPGTSFQSSSNSNGGGAAGPSAQMIHNNIEPRCKKNKKCNEEREPLKPIKSENKNKPSEQ